MSLKKTYSHDELVALLRSKSQEGFSYLYDNYSRALFGIIAPIVNNTEEAEDVLQKTFVKIWSNFGSYDENKGRLYTWMLNIARNLAIDATRSKHQKARSIIQSASGNVYESDKNMRVEDKKHEYIGVNDLLNGLSEELKNLIQLAYFEGYTQEEISKKIPMPLGTVKTKIRQALLKLRELTKKELIG